MQNHKQDESPEVTVEGKWHLVTLTQASKRELFCKQILHAVEQEKLQGLIFSVEMPKESVYQNLVLLEVSSLKAARNYIQQIGYVQRIEPKPLTTEQVDKMLGRQK